jgi:hypothetical protein
MPRVRMRGRIYHQVILIFEESPACHINLYPTDNSSIIFGFYK